MQDCRIRKEKIDGVIYDMSPRPHYHHGAINGNIFCAIKNALKGSLCLVYMENIEYHYNPKTDDYVEPDIIICCDRKELIGGAYYGIPKFVVETLSPSTMKRDRGIKKDVYERCGVSEYWIVSPREQSLEIYYLKDGKYEIQEAYALEEDEKVEEYNANLPVTLREFPISMTLSDIFTI